MLSLITTPHRPIYPALTTPQQAYLMIEVMPEESTPPQRTQAINYCLVLDRSGSMAGEKLRAMKQAARAVVDRLGPQDRLGVVIFDDADPAEVVFPAGPVNDRAGLHGRLDAIEERGGTHMSTGMRLGLEQLLVGAGPERVSRMLLLTDGQTWEDVEDCKRLADRCRQAGIPIQVFGLGIGDESNWDPRLLEDIAQRSGGEWTPVENLSQVGELFAKDVVTAQGVAAVNARLTLRLVQGVNPRTVWRVTPLISRLDHESISAHDVQVFLGDIPYGSGQGLLVDLLLPARMPGSYRLAQADVTYDLPYQGLTGQRAQAEVVLEFNSDPGTNSYNSSMMNLIERVVAHRLQTQALDEAAAGNAALATQKLRAAATRLLELGETELAQQAELQAGKLENSGQLDTAAAQKMRYATKRLSDLES